MVRRSYLRPIHAEAQMPAGERAFHHDVIGQAVQARILAQEQLQRAQDETMMPSLASRKRGWSSIRQTSPGAGLPPA